MRKVGPGGIVFLDEPDAGFQCKFVHSQLHNFCLRRVNWCLKRQHRIRQLLATAVHYIHNKFQSKS